MLSVKKINQSDYTKIWVGKPMSFLQTAEWGNFKQMVGEYKAHFFQIEDKEIIGGFVALEKKLRFFPFISIYYIPRTLLVFDHKRLLNPRFFGQLLKAVEQIHPLIIIEFNYPHFDKEFLKPDEFKAYLQKQALRSGYSTAPLKIQPRSSLIKSTFSENLLESIPSRDARRNVKRGLKRLQNTQIKFATRGKLNGHDLQVAFSLIAGVSRNKKFATRSLDYFRQLQNNILNTIWFLFVDGASNQILLANLGIADPVSSTYYDLYVGRDIKYDSHYLSYLLKYFSFDYLRDKQIQFYDHWGIDLNQASRQYGFSTFKMHFGGNIINYPEIILLSKWKKISRWGIRLWQYFCLILGAA